MAFVDSLLSFFRRPAAETAAAVPEGACPNCWGHYEYDGVVREAIRDKQIDINNERASRAFIEEFVVTRLEGVRLKSAGCPTCNTVRGGR
ncbi:MAG: hypothetical protein GY812_16345 [Actinomycetia bacterium]|nr:hypothetical protein [Actinomycetes bacterium]